MSLCHPDIWNFPVVCSCLENVEHVTDGALFRIAGCQEALVRKTQGDRIGDACEWEYEGERSGEAKETKSVTRVIG